MIDESKHGIIVKPVSITDILYALGTDESDLGTLCTSPKINTTSRSKPTNSNYLNSCGYYIPEFNDFQLFREFAMTGVITEQMSETYYNLVDRYNFWKYVPKDPPYELDDFNNHNPYDWRSIFYYTFTIYNRNNNEKIRETWITEGDNFESFLEELLDDPLEMDRNDIFSFSIGQWLYGIYEFEEIKNYHVGVAFIGDVNYLLVNNNYIYLESKGTITVKGNLLDLSVGNYKVVPIIIDSRKDLSRSLIMPIMPPFDITITGEILSNVFLTFSGYSKEYNKGNVYYTIKGIIHNIGTELEYPYIKDVSYGTIGELFTGGEQLENNVLPTNIDGVGAARLGPKSTLNFSIKTVSDTGIINLEFYLYKKDSSLEDIQVKKYTYKIYENNLLDPYLEIYLLGLDTNDQSHPSRYNDDNFSMDWNGVVPIMTDGFNYKPLNITIDSELSVYPIYIDDVGVALCRKYYDAPKDRIDESEITVESTVPSIREYLTTTFNSHYLERTGGEYLCGENESKLIRIPYSGIGKTLDENNIIQFTKYTSGYYLPLDMCSDVYTKMPELKIINYRYKYDDNLSPEFIDINDYRSQSDMSFRLSRYGLKRRLYYAATPNQTDKYRIWCIKFMRYITFIQEPYSESRIYYGTPFDSEYIFEGNNTFDGAINCPECNGKGYIEHKESKYENGHWVIKVNESNCERCNGTGEINSHLEEISEFDYIFSTLNSKVLTENSYELNLSNCILCYPENSFDYNISIKLGKNEVIIEEKNTFSYMWGTLKYIIKKLPNSYKVTFTKK